ncbi:hypothetical protein [Chryseobacterium indologenes]|uniref:hypothetical protein n=1 Tax=Chryseobacterium indologenes TaxID=253 RepID=UPI00162AD37F|nr:hypothetical protein [Chryseobacterium indologenes]
MENTRKLQLKKIFNYCLNNNLFFNFYPHVESVHIHSENQKINLMAYYDGDLYGYEDEIMPFVHIEKAIDLIKEFKQSNQ